MRIGSVYSAAVRHTLSDGTRTAYMAEMLILDFVRRDDGRTCRILAQEMECSWKSASRLPGAIRIGVYDTVGHPVDPPPDAPESIDYERSFPLYKYTPRDPNGNSVDILRREAYAALERMEECGAR